MVEKKFIVNNKLFKNENLISIIFVFLLDGELPDDITVNEVEDAYCFDTLDDCNIFCEVREGYTDITDIVLTAIAKMQNINSNLN